MKYTQIFTSLLLLAGSAVAAPSSAPVPAKLRSREASAADIVAAIVSGAKTCPTGNTDCRTAAQAAPFLITAMQRYGITNTAEMAATIALMAYESDDFTYKRNQSPGRPGQGTANMQLLKWNIPYAQSIPELATQVAALGTVSTDDQANQLLDLVIDDNYNFASGPWFLTTQCASARPELQTGSDAGWAAYMACIDVPVSADRTAYWTRAKTAFGITA